MLKRTCDFKEFELLVQKYRYYSKLNGQYRGHLLWPFNERRNIHLENERKIHTNSENYEESTYNLLIGFANHLVLLTCFVF